MSYYKNQQEAFKELDRLYKEAIETGKKINEQALIYEITLHFAISERVIKKRLELLKQVLNGA